MATRKKPQSSRQVSAQTDASDLELLRAAFLEMNAGDMVALADAGPTQSGGREDLADAAYRRGLQRFHGVFWHEQSHESAFDDEGNLIHELRLHWQGSRTRIAAALKKHLAFPFESPADPDHAFIVRPPTPIDPDPRRRLDALRVVHAIREPSANANAFVRAVIRDGDIRALPAAIHRATTCGLTWTVEDADVVLSRLDELTRAEPSIRARYFSQVAIETCFGQILSVLADVSHHAYADIASAWADGNDPRLRRALATWGARPELLPLLRRLLSDPELVHPAIASIVRVEQGSGKPAADALLELTESRDSTPDVKRVCIDQLASLHVEELGDHVRTRLQMLYAEGRLAPSRSLAELIGVSAADPRETAHVQQLIRAMHGNRGDDEMVLLRSVLREGDITLLPLAISRWPVHQVAVLEGELSYIVEPITEPDDVAQLLHRLNELEDAPLVPDYERSAVLVFLLRAMAVTGHPNYLATAESWMTDSRRRFAIASTPEPELARILRRIIDDYRVAFEAGDSTRISECLAAQDSLIQIARSTGCSHEQALLDRIEDPITPVGAQHACVDKLRELRTKWIYKGGQYDDARVRARLEEIRNAGRLDAAMNATHHRHSIEWLMLDEKSSGKR